jgi:photosystem II stability/assembly factor-like uncharacterized protein
MLLELPLVLALAAPQAGTWTQQGPLPTGLDVHDVELISPTEAWILGEADALHHTVDSGLTWSKVPLDTASLWDLFFLDAQHGWAVGNDVFRTTDGGKTWEKSPTVLGSVDAAHFVDPLHGWVTAANAVYRTSDGGTTWETGLVPALAACHGIFFVDAQTGFIANIAGEVFKTVDGGKSWSPVLTGGGANLNTVWFADASTGYVCASDRVHKTTDGGGSWQTTPLPAGAWMYGGDFLDAQTAWLVGAGASVVTTTDGWASATMQATPGGHSLLWGVAFADEAFGLAVGEEGRILASGDGGVTCVQRDSGGMNAYGLDVNDVAHAWIGLDRGDVARTANGGAQWLTVAVDGFGVFGSVRGVDFHTDDLTGWATGWDEQFSGTFGRISRSLDGGRTWEPQYSQIDAFFEDVAAIDASTAVAVGSVFGPGDLLMRTQDGGSSWTNVAPGLGSYDAVDFADAQHGWVVGGKISATTDGGLTWHEQANPQYFVHDVSFSDPLHGWAVGEFGTALRTTDGGATWSPITAPIVASQDALLSVHAVDADTAWVTTGENKVLRTLDGGDSWSVESLPFLPGYPATATAIAFLDADYGWLGAGPRVDNGGPWRRSAGAPPGLALLNDRMRQGSATELRVTGATAGFPVAVAYSLSGIGAGPCLGDACVGLLPPWFVLGGGVADGTGSFALGVAIPPGLPYLEVHAQAVALPPGGVAFSNTTSTPIEP